LTKKPKMYILTKGNEIETVLCGKDFLKDVYPKLLDGWHIITTQPLNDLKLKAPAIKNPITRYMKIETVE